MPLFVCSNEECRSLENTALGEYWTRLRGQGLCSACATGEWHGKFQRLRVLPPYPEGSFRSQSEVTTEPFDAPKA